METYPDQFTRASGIFDRLARSLKTYDARIIRIESARQLGCNGEVIVTRRDGGRFIIPRRGFPQTFARRCAG